MKNKKLAIWTIMMVCMSWSIQAALEQKAAEYRLSPRRSKKNTTPTSSPVSVAQGNRSFSPMQRSKSDQQTSGRTIWYTQRADKLIFPDIVSTGDSLTASQEGQVHNVIAFINRGGFIPTYSDTEPTVSPSYQSKKEKEIPGHKKPLPSQYNYRYEHASL